MIDDRIPPGVPPLNLNIAKAMGNPVQSIEDKIAAEVDKLGETLIADLEAALSLASFKDATSGAVADPAGAQAYAAVLPIVKLIVHGPSMAPGAAPAGPPGPITFIAKARIVRIAIQSPAFQQAIAPMVQDIQQQLGSVLTGGLGFARVLGLAAL